MKKTQGYSVEFKKAAVRKLLNRGSRTVEDILNEIGISSPTIYQWRDKFAISLNMKKSSKPQGRSTQEKIKAVHEYNQLPVEKRGEYLRKNGLHLENIKQWTSLMEEALSNKKNPSKMNAEILSEKKKVQRLEKELRRKEKALAEASALLILKKKADLIWGKGEDE